MYKRVAAVLLPITLVALVGTTVWGYQENQDKNSILIKAENQYQRAFHELNFHLDQLQDELGKSLALNSRRQQSSSMTKVWRLAYAAQNDVSRLPLSLMPFDNTAKFLGRVGDFSYRIGVRDLERQPLTDKEWETLRTLYKRSGQIQRDLAKVQEQVLSKNLRWMDVETAMAAEDKVMNNTIIDGFKKVNQMVKESPDVDWGPTIHNSEVRKREKIANLRGRNVTAEEVKQKFSQVLDRPDTKGIKVTRNKGGEYEVYSLRLDRDHQEVQADFTRKGGNLLWMMYDRPVKKRNLNLDQAQKRAAAFLHRAGYPGMEAVSYDEEGNMISFTFVHKEDDLFIYPEAVVIKVALDNGEVIALQANEYVFNKRDREVAKPKLSKDQARKYVNPRLKVQESNLAIIYGEDGNEVLCYEFMGRLGQSHYRIFINAENGEEEFVEKMKQEQI